MAYKIEDIDWNVMPAGAVEFSLEDDDYFHTWYDANGSSWDYHESEWCVEYKSVIRRVRHRVSDYHPPTTANRKPTREERLDKALRTLIQGNFVGNELEWSWKEGRSLEDIDPSLYNEIVDLLKIREEQK